MGKLQKYQKDIITISIICIIIAAFFSRLFSPQLSLFATAEIGINDIWYFNFPLKNFLAQRLSENQIPTWNPYRGGGFPDLAESQVGPYNAYNLIAFKLLPPAVAFNLGHIVIFATCALGMYLFIKNQGFSRLYSFFGSLLYALSGFFVTHLSHYLLIQTASFFPFLCYFADRILKQKRVSIFSVLLFAVILSQQIFSGNPQTVFISLLGICSVATFAVVVKKTRIFNLMVLCVAIGIGIFISAAQLLPTMELSKLSSRGGGVNTNELLSYKYPLTHLITFIAPFWFGNPQIGTYPHFNNFNGSLFWENTGYIGILPLIAILMALAWGRRNKNIWFYASILIICLLLMIGGDSPFYFILLIPPFSFFLFPSRFLLIFIFALVMLSLYGFKYIEAHFDKNKKNPRYISPIFMCIALLQLFLFWYWYHPTVPFNTYAKPPKTVEYLQTVAHGRVYSYLQNARSFNEFFKSGSKYPQRYIELENELAPNINVLFHIETPDVYSSLIPKRLFYFNAGLSSSYKIATDSAQLPDTMLRKLSLRNTTHIISPIALLNDTLSLEKKFSLTEGMGDIYIYKNAAALPDYYVINNVGLVETITDFNSAISADTFDIQKQALVEERIENIQTNTPLEYQIKPLIKKDDFHSLQVKTNQDALLVINQNYYPGWHATIDSRPSKLQPVNLVNQGLVVEKGSHVVTLRFESETVQRGLWVTIVGYGVIGILLVISAWNNIKSSKLNSDY